MDLNHLFQSLIAFGLGLLGWSIKGLFSRLDSICEDIIRIKVVLMGPEGDNGLRSDVRALDSALDETISRLDKAQIP